jgi:hypothetical protein
MPGSATCSPKPVPPAELKRSMPALATCSQQTGFYLLGAVAAAGALGPPEEVRTGFFTCRARTQLPLPHRQGFFLKGQNRFLPSGRGRCCLCLTTKVVFLRGQNQFLPAGRSRCCHRFTAKGRPEEVTSLFQQHVNADNVSRHFKFLSLQN